MRLMTVPMSSLDQPTLVKLAARYDVSLAALNKQHVLFMDAVPNGEDEARLQRVVTFVAVVGQPINVPVLGVGASIKSPDDTHSPLRGQAIALARAIHSI